MSVGPFTTFTRGNCFVPGAYDLPYEYWMHGSHLCVFVTFPPSASFRDAPVAMFVPGDTYGHLEVYGGMMAQFSAYPKQLALAAAMSAAGWVVISVGYPAAGLNAYSANNANTAVAGGFRVAGTWGEIPPVAMWPEQPYYLARAIQHVKDNADALTTPFGKQLFGTGNSIDPNKIVLIGMKHGATMAMKTAMQPTGLYSFDRNISHESQDQFFPRSSHRVAAVVATDPMIDFTQFHIAQEYSTLSPAPAMFQGDKWAVFTRSEDRQPWSQIPVVRKQASPWWFLQTRDSENANLGFFTEFSGTGFASALWDANLVAADWNPGTVANNTAAGKAWIDPANGTFQGPNWAQGILDKYSSGLIRNSVTKYGSTLTTSGTYAATVMSWLEGYGL